MTTVWLGPPGACYRRLHERGLAGWSVECSECGRVAGGVGADSLDAIDALMLALRHDRDCPEIVRARRRYEARRAQEEHEEATSRVRALRAASKPPT